MWWLSRSPCRCRDVTFPEWWSSLIFLSWPLSESGGADHLILVCVTEARWCSYSSSSSSVHARGDRLKVPDIVKDLNDFVRGELTFKKMILRVSLRVSKPLPNETLRRILRNIFLLLYAWHACCARIIVPTFWYHVLVLPFRCVCAKMWSAQHLEGENLFAHGSIAKCH